MFTLTHPNTYNYIPKLANRTLFQASQSVSITYGWLFNFLPTVISVFITVITTTSIASRLIQKTKKKLKNKPIMTSPVIDSCSDKKTVSFRMNNLALEQEASDTKRSSEQSQSDMQNLPSLKSPRGSEVINESPESNGNHLKESFNFTIRRASFNVFASKSRANKVAKQKIMK